MLEREKISINLLFSIAHSIVKMSLKFKLMLTHVYLLSSFMAFFLLLLLILLFHLSYSFHLPPSLLTLFFNWSFHSAMRCSAVCCVVCRVHHPIHSLSFRSLSPISPAIRSFLWYGIAAAAASADDDADVAALMFVPVQGEAFGLFNSFFCHQMRHSVYKHYLLQIQIHYTIHT